MRFDAYGEEDASPAGLPGAPPAPSSNTRTCQNTSSLNDVELQRRSEAAGCWSRIAVKCGMDHDDDSWPDDVSDVAELTQRVKEACVEIRRSSRAIRRGFPPPAHVRRVREEARRLCREAVVLRRRAAQLGRIH